jgi:hypothetical protein
VTTESSVTLIIRRMKLWPTIINLYHFVMWLAGLEHFVDVAQQLRDPWF